MRCMQEVAGSMQQMVNIIGPKLASSRYSDLGPLSSVPVPFQR